MPPSSSVASPDLFPVPKHRQNLQHRRTRARHSASFVVVRMHKNADDPFQALAHVTCHGVLAFKEGQQSATDALLIHG